MSNRKWMWDFDFFNRRTPTVAYWAGFNMADGSLGSIGKNSYSLTIGLSYEDINHLKRFCSDIKLPEESIYNYGETDGGIIDGRQIKGGKSCMVKINHELLAEHLLPWGIVERKTYNFVAPNVPDSLLKDYLRGWFDGDGYAYFNGRGARFSVAGNYSGMGWYSDALRKLGYDGHISIKQRSKTATLLYIGGVNQTNRIKDLLIGEPRLYRKWDTEYESKPTMFLHTCEVCGVDFEVPKYRHEHEPENGRFCSKKCFDINQRKPVIKGKKQCARCKEMVLLEDFSGNPSYCKKCWREYARQYKINSLGDIK